MTKQNYGRMFSVALILLMISLVIVFSALAIDSSRSAEPQLDIVATNLSFSESIYLKYAVSVGNIGGQDDVKLLVWTSPSDSYIFGTQDAVLSSVGTNTVNGIDCLIFDFKQLAAKQMTDYVYARAYYATSDGDYYSDVKKYSILTYIYNKLGYTGTPTENEDLANLLNGLLDYGASAQQYFNYKTDTLATDKHVKITLENGTFLDGSKTTLATPGATLKVIASSSNGSASFSYWTDKSGKILSTSSTFEFVVGAENSTLSAVFIANQGGFIEGAGANLSTNSFAMSKHDVDSSNVTDISAQDLANLVKNNQLLSNGVYRISDGNALTITSSVNGNGAAIISPAGIIVEDCSSITVRNIILVGDVTVNGSNNVTFTQVDVQGASNAFTVDTASTNITFDDCRINSSNAGITTNALNTVVKNTYVNASNAITSSAKELTVYNCEILAKESGVASSSEDSAINNNTITMSAVGNGIVINSGAVNSLLSFNQIVGSADSIKVLDATNTSVLFNSAYNIVAENSISTYVVENSLGGKLLLKDNNYLLCDSNTYSGSNNHMPDMTGNENVNGDSLMDVNARNEVGAKEELLPHTNKDLFLGMTPKSTVKDAIGGTSLTLGQYITTNAAGKSIVIVPPGYYTMNTHFTLGSTHSNTEIYAYGVYNERVFAGRDVDNLTFQFGDAKNVTVHGLTVGYNHQSAGQVHVLKKSSSGLVNKTYTLTLVSAAGYVDSFGSLDTNKFASGSFDLVKQGEIHWTSYNYSALTANSDGTMTMTVSQEAYNNIVAGDVLYCRLAGDNKYTIYFGNGIDDIKLKDCTIYGYAAALAMVGGGGSQGVSLERVHNTVHSPYLIDEETYNKYLEWENTYGVELVSIDALGRYRGSTPVAGSVDATHLSGANEGFTAISCLFENMCDDGSNHRGSSSRLHGYKINSDGTATLYIKANIAQYYFNDNINRGTTQANANPVNFAKGQNVYIYTSKGELVCDTVALTSMVSSNSTTSISFPYTDGSGRTLTYTLGIYEITVDAADCNFDVLAGYDLSDNHYAMAQKVLVDNISRNSSGGHFDNVLVQNIRSRGFLVKSTDILIENCTFRNLAMTGVLMSIETTWGESTVSRNVIVRNTLFDKTGFRSDSFDSSPTLAPISISSLVTYGNTALDSLRSENIIIEGNEFRDYGHSYGIYINGAKDVHILNNVFDPIDTNTPGEFVKIVTASDIEISGNTYKNAAGTVSPVTISKAEDYGYIYGDNVSGSSLSKCDIFINGKHIVHYNVVAANALNKDVAESLASSLSELGGYTITSASQPKGYTILLVANDNTSNSISSNKYTVVCNGNTLTITAATRGALSYAINDFVERLEAQNKSVIEIKSGDSFTYTFESNITPATDITKFKYVGTWQATDPDNPTTMVSYWDSAYVEFDFTGTSVTLLFSSPSKCNVSIDGGAAISYTVSDELMLSVSKSGTHTVRVHYGDKSEHMYFAGVRVPEGQSVSRTADRPIYIQFVGDSISDSPLSFSHNAADILGWDYSVIACEALSLQADKGYWRYNNGFTNETGYASGSMAYLLNKNFGTVSIGMEDAFFKLGIPNKMTAGTAEFNDIAANYFTDKYDFDFNTGYTPDIVFIFLGTNDLGDSASQTDINNFVESYKSFVADIVAKYGSSVKICAMQALSTSNTSDLYNTEHPRYVAIAQAASALESIYGDRFDFIDAATVLSWNVEISTDGTHPTASGYETLTNKVAEYLLNTYVGSNYVNHSFSISGIRKYNNGTNKWSGPDSTGTDGNISYSGFSFTQTGHINISGQYSSWLSKQDNYAVNINGSTGRYLVLMYRTSGNTSLTLEMRTSTKNDSANQNGQDILSSVTRPMALAPTDWEIAVVDLSQFPNYTCNQSGLKVQVRITTAMSQLDIAYAGIVDSMEEASWVTRFKLSSGKMYVYDNFAEMGETVYLTQKAYEEDQKKKLDYVNHIYDISNMKMFLSVGNITTNPSLVNVEDPDGVRYTRFCFTSDGHVFFDGSNEPISINGDSGRYLVMKYRTLNSTNRISINARTSDKSQLSTITKASSLFPDTWEVAVIDLSQFVNYSTDSNNNVLIRITSMCENLDISYAAIVDDIDEAEQYADAMGNDSAYVLYKNWAAAGESHFLP
ncbi:MAG: hypothetical protein E7611_01390 [Ruminococcaceae bacterium]|nr:hypothetical protein [Oscillospiraceae bacterium]